MSKITVKEAHVRDSLAEQLEKIEPGLTFVAKEAKLPSSIGTTGFIDLLATDVEGRYVLVEVKRTDAATREAIHEILKYIEGVKAHLGLRENELRVIIASVEWRELLVPFSSFVERTTCRVEGYRLEINVDGAVVAATVVDPLPIQSDRVLAPWHELQFYKDEKSLTAGIASYEVANTAKDIESYVLVIMDAPAGHPIGYPSTKQITNRGLLAEMVSGMGQSVKEVPDDLYQSIAYFSMQQLSKNEYLSRLPSDIESKKEILEAIVGMDEEEELLALHEAILDAEPRPESDYFEIGYAAKFRGRLLEDEGWKVREIRRYGYFSRNTLLEDETILEEIGGSQGNSGQSMKLSFRPNQKAEVAEARRRANDCLCNNDPWRSQINFVLDELAASGEERQCYLQIMNPSSAITTIYLSSSREDGALYVPTYQLRVPEIDTERMYYGVLEHNGSNPHRLSQIVDEFYQADTFRLLFTLQWGGYEPRDVKIVRRLGLRYRTFHMSRDGEARTYTKLDGHEWEDCGPVDPLTAYFSFMERHDALTREIFDLYSSHWDGHVVAFDKGDE